MNKFLILKVTNQLKNLTNEEKLNNNINYRYYIL